MSKINLQNEEDFSENDFIDDLDFRENFKKADDEKEEKIKDDLVTLNFSKIKLIKNLISSSEENLKKAKDLLSVYLSSEDEERISIGQLDDDNFESSEKETGQGRIIEGVFDGEQMIGPDGKHYSIPANYASKSKLIEGDILKLTISPSGTFIYKQIGPIERKRVIAILEQDEASNFYALADGKKWKVLTASVTYYKGSHGDEVVILIPKSGESQWAAVENIVKKSF